LTFTGGTNNDFNGAPDISPDGTTILFQHNSDIWTIGMNGSGLTQVTNTPGFEAAPSWAPNGADYAYMQLDGGGTDWNIYRNTVPAPEPASTGLAMLGGLALLLRRRRS
jgi:TolB protein